MSLPTAVPDRALVTVLGAQVRVPDPDRLVHLQFRRFAGCPVCNLHLRSIVTRHEEIAAAGIREVIVFHSSAEELRKYTADLPLDVIADPARELYREFGVETSPRALLDPRGWPAIVRGVAHAAWATVRGKQAAPPAEPEGGSLGLPANFLIAPDGRVLAGKHGEHVYDQWSVDELLALVPAERHA
ncbi:peroxiredoxin-like family protein [Nocardia asteroides]